MYVINVLSVSPVFCLFHSALFVLSLPNPYNVSIHNVPIKGFLVHWPGYDSQPGRSRVSLGKTLNSFSASLHRGKYKWVPGLLGVNKVIVFVRSLVD